jgi:hypothetical protein
MATVYRVQNEHGLGPYRGRSIDQHTDVVRSILMSHSDMFDSHPTPLMDTGIERYMKEDELCAFCCMDSLLQWFEPALLEALKDEGFYIYKIKAKITKVGEHQVLIDGETVKELEKV